MPSVWVKVDAENLVKQISGVFYLQAKVGGKKIRESLKTTNLRTAKIKRDARLGALRLSTARGADEIRTMGEALALVEARETGKPNLKPRTKDYYTELFALLRKTLPVDRAGASFTADEAASWWQMVGQGTKTFKKRSSTQANNLLRFLKKAMEAIRNAGLRFDDPCAELKRLKVKKTAVEKLPSRANFVRIVQRVKAGPEGPGKGRRRHSDQAAMMIEFLAWSGMRIGELRAATWQDVGDAWLIVHGGESGTKGGETRMVPINPLLADVIARMRKPGAKGPLFTMKSPREALKFACIDLELTHMRVHDLRHLFATQSIESGVDIPTVSRWLGHKDGGALAMKTYGHLRDDHSLESAKKLA